MLSFNQRKTSLVEKTMISCGGSGSGSTPSVSVSSPSWGQRFGKLGTPRHQGISYPSPPGFCGNLGPIKNCVCRTLGAEGHFLLVG